MIDALLEFLGNSPTPYHAVRNMVLALDDAGFQRLHEGDAWSTEAGRFYVVRGGSSIVAFGTGTRDPGAAGIRMVGAHTDSPCLKIKPNPELKQHGYLQLGVEVYGGVLMNPWFDRDLSLAGRVTYVASGGEIKNALINYRDPIAFIPSLAIHLDREVNKNRSIDPQTHLPPVLLQIDKDMPDFRELLLQRLREEHPGVGAERVLDYDLCLFDAQPPATVGLHGEFVASARLDNLLSCFIGLHGLLAAKSDQPCLLVCNDHEEVGSQSAIGAQGPFLQSVLRRWCGEAYQRAMTRSMLISADNAHGIHPNYADRHDRNHGPLLNHGPVIKVNSNQRYATNSETSAIYRKLCEDNQVPVQVFVTRTDLACGSTIGPLTSGEIGVPTVDVGIPQFAMHSIREQCGVKDVDYLHTTLTAFFNQDRVRASDDL